MIILTFLGITLLVFTITRFVPGGPVERMLLQAQVSQNESGCSSGSKGAQALSDEQIEELKAFYGLDKPALVAYWDWLDFCRSWRCWISGVDPLLRAGVGSIKERGCRPPSSGRHLC